MLAAGEISEKGYEDGLEVRDYLDDAEAKIFEVTQRRDKSGPEPLKGLVKKVFSSLDERFKSPDGITGVPTGFSDLDTKTAGLPPTELVILAARPAMGKTSFAMSLAQNAATSAGWPCLVFSLEMSSTQLAERMLCSEARVAAQAPDPDRRPPGPAAARAPRPRPPVPLQPRPVRRQEVRPHRDRLPPA